MYKSTAMNSPMRPLVLLVCILSASACQNETCAPGFTGCDCDPCVNAPELGAFNWTVECGVQCAEGLVLYGTSPSTWCLVPCPACLPGFESVPCTPWSDGCAACNPPSEDPASFQWMGADCGAFQCTHGWYRLDGKCLPCMDSIVCPPGFLAHECTRDENALCVPCDVDLPWGAEWIDGCQFACSGKFFQDVGGGCTPCDESRDCGVGSYLINCTGFADSYCVACPRPIGAFKWTNHGRCDFQCADGWYLDGPGVCLRCSELLCGPGYTPSPCSRDVDSVCVACGFFEGVVYDADGCENFHCVEGLYYRRNNSCIPCQESVQCLPAGEFYAPCTQESDARCELCPGVENLERWINGCDEFACREGYYRSEMGCVECNTSLVCPPGYEAVGCGDGIEARSCAACPLLDMPGLIFTTGCVFDCADGFFLTNERVCQPCSNNVSCQIGQTLSMCTATSDAACVPCLVPDVPFRWTQGCDFECEGSSCLSGFVVVNSTLSLDNSIAEVCRDLALLLVAISEALLSVSSVEYVTNITSLNNEACDGFRCPQCFAPNGNRRLLSSVSIGLVSQSTSTVDSAIIVPSLLAQVVQVSLSNASSALHPGVFVADIEAIMRVNPAPGIDSVFDDVFWVVMGLFLLCMLVLLTAFGGLMGTCLGKSRVRKHRPRAPQSDPAALSMRQY